MHVTHLPALAIACAATLLVSCTMVSVETDADPQANFAKYRTYALSPAPALGSRPLSPSSFATLQSSLETGLAARGIRKASNPSFVVIYHADTQPRTNMFLIPSWGWYGGTGRGGYFGAQPMMSQFTEGMLVLDFVDTKTRRIIWRGTATGLVGSQRENQKSIAESVRKMLEDFPPKHRTS